MKKNISQLSIKQRNQLIGYLKDAKKEKVKIDKPVKHSKTHYTNAL